MKRIRYTSLALAAIAMLVAGAAFAATPLVNSAVVKERVFNDAPGTVLTTTNAYPSFIKFEESGFDGTFGFANFHTWRLSTNGVDAAQFENNSIFHLRADIVMFGPGFGEMGLQLAPWWSECCDGLFNMRLPDGEVAVFGGRLPFYSFTAAYGVRYNVAGKVATMEFDYKPNGLSAASPATIEYKYTLDGVTYSSGPLAFSEGNPNEPQYGFWGILTPAYVGGHVKHFLPGDAEGRNSNESLFGNICFTTPATPTTTTTFGKVKALYR